MLGGDKVTSQQVGDLVMKYLKKLDVLPTLGLCWSVRGLKIVICKH